MNRCLLAALPLLSPALFAQGLLESVEPNNTTATATILPAGVQGYGDISAGDEDWFKVTLSANSDLKIWAGAGFAAPIDDTRVRIYAADGVTILIDVDDGNTTTHGFYSTFAVGNYAPGDYYVAVRGYSASTAGSYTLDVVAGAPGTYVAVAPPLTAVAEAAEDNDPRNVGGVATASGVFTANTGFIAPPLPGTTSGTSELTVGKDYDFYAVNITTVGSHIFRTTNSATAPAPVINDTVLRLFDPALVSLAVNDDFSGAFSQITYSITTPGTYYLCVSGYYGDTASASTGNYLLEVLGPLPALPTGQASTTIQSGGCVATLGTRAPGSGSGSELPVLGSQYWLDGANLQPNAPLFRVIGLLPLGSPFDLGPLGAPGCQVEVDPLDNSFALADAAGVFFWNMDLPVGLALIGLPLEQQIVALDATANAAGLVASNRVSSVCGITH